MMPSDERDQFLSELYTKYMDDLIRYCRAYVEYNTEYYDLILDVIQDTFLAANIEYEKLKDHPHIEGWLYKACRFRLTNAIKTYRRKKKRHAFSMDQKGMELPDTTCSVIDSWLSEETVKQYEKQIFTLLNDTEQLIYYDYFKKRKSIKQIAAETQKSESAVKSVISRIRAKLRKYKIISFFQNLFLM